MKKWKWRRIVWLYYYRNVMKYDIQCKWMIMDNNVLKWRMKYMIIIDILLSYYYYWYWEKIWYSIGNEREWRRGNEMIRLLKW